MRITLAILTAFTLAACSGAPKAGTSATASSTQTPKTDVELRWTMFEEATSVTHQAMESDDTALALDSMFNAFGDDKAQGLCYAGDIGRVCSLLSKMSKLSEDEYTDGNHGLILLKGCRIIARDKSVDAGFELSNDYDEGVRKAQLTIPACDAE
jgi:hypothetical protein